MHQQKTTKKYLWFFSSLYK